MTRPALTGRHYLPVGNLHLTAGDPVLMTTELRAMLGGPVAVDIETYGLGADARRLKTVTFASTERAVVCDPREPTQRRLIERFLMTPRVPEWIFHSSTFDVPNLWINGFVLDRGKITDTLLYARLAWPDVVVRKDLESCAVRMLGEQRAVPMKKIFQQLGMKISDGWKLFDIDRPVYLFGCARDATVTARLIEPLRREAITVLTEGHPFVQWGLSKLDAERLVEREQRINRMLLRRACTGLRVDLDYLDRYRDQHGRERIAVEAELTGHGIRPGNAGDLIKVLDSIGALPDDHPRTPKTGRPSTTAAALGRLGHPLASAFTRAKQIAKIEDDYLSKVGVLEVAGRIHPVVNLLKAVTGRMSIGDPPLQQFPAGARGVVLADPGDAMVSIDWSQIEPVFAANVGGDIDLLGPYEAGTGDLYTTLAERAQISRSSAKVVLLAQMYGEGIAKLAADLGVPVDDAYDLRRWIMDAMPKTSRLLSNLRSIGENHRKIFTLSGRILPIPMGTYSGEVSVQTHKAINYFVQGGAYDLLAEALVRIDEAGLGDGVYLAMHDELVVSADVAEDVRRIMVAPPARMIELSKRTPVLRTDMETLGERWAKI